MKRYAITLILSFFAMLLHAQNNGDAANLEAQLKKSLHDSSRIRILKELALNYKVSDTVQAWHYLVDLESFAKKEANAQALGVCFSTKGSILSYHGEYHRAVKLFEQAKSQFLLSNQMAELGNVTVDEGNAYLFLAEYEAALEKYQAALEIFLELNHTKGMSRCYNNMGIIYKNFGYYDEALSSYAAVVDLYEGTEDISNLVDTYINMGVVYVLQGKYHIALEYFNRALLNAEESGNKMQQTISLMNSGVIQNKMENYLNALKYYENALAVAREMDNKVEISKCLTNIGTNYISLKEYDLAEDFILKGLELKEELGDTRSIANCHSFLAEIEYFRGNFSRSLELDKKAIELKREVQDQEGITRIFSNESRTYLAMGNNRRALAYADSTLIYATEIGSLEHLTQAYFLKKEVLSDMNEYRLAFEMADLYKIFSDSLMNEKKAKALNEIESRYQAKLLQDENLSLQQKAEIDQELIIRHRKIILFEMLAILLVVFVIILLATIQRKQKQYRLTLEKKNQVITKQNIKLDTLNRTKDKVLSVMTHDLRGTIGNQLTALSLLGREEFRNEEEKRVVFSRLANSATLSLELLENLSLWNKIQEESIAYNPEQDYLDKTFEDVIEVFRESLNNKEIKLDHSVNEEFPGFYDHFMIKNVLKNLLSNAIKFSQRGGVIKTAINLEEDKVTIMITDFGAGVSKGEIAQLVKGQIVKMRRGTENEKGSGLGLSIVKYFLDQHNTKLDFVSKKSGGTKVSFSLPLQRPV